MTPSPAMRATAAVCLAALLLAGCTDDEPDNGITLPSPSESAEVATPEPSPEPDASATPDDPFAVPDEITPEYVERVLNEINRIDAEITKDILRMPIDEDALELPADIQARLETIYAEPILTLNQRGKADLLRSENQRADLRTLDEFDQLSMAVEAVLEASECILARIDRDFSGVDAEPDDETTNLAFVFLAPSTADGATPFQMARIVTTDAAPGSPDEEALRTLEAGALAGEEPEVCA